MLRIRPEQMKALGLSMQRRFETQTLRFLRLAYKERVAQYSDETLLALIRRGVDESERYGFVTESQVRRYIQYMVAYGPDFDRQPWAAEILTAEITSAQKLDRLDDYDLFSGRDGHG